MKMTNMNLVQVLLRQQTNRPHLGYLIALAMSTMVNLSGNWLRAADGQNVSTYISTLPSGYQASLFAKPPEVNYPVSVSVSGTGEVFVAIDQNGATERTPHRGKILRLVDTKGTGVADHIEAFVPDVDTPRGIYYDGATLYCLHPPFLTAYHDAHDGSPGLREDLLTGIGYGLDTHPGDHTCEGIREAIDGWIYMAIGDFGIPDAKGKDGSDLSMRGGGIVRVRPDGTEIEIYCHHTRNVLDVAMDPYLNGFIYDNTNDGDGWNSRLSFLVGLCDFGYPSLYTRFGHELLPCMADFGGGAAVGSLYLHEPGFPNGDGDALYTCDWGTGGIYRDPLTIDGAGFSSPKRNEWAHVDHVTDMDVDGNSHLFISTWKNGACGPGFNSTGVNVGAILELRNANADAAHFPDLKKASDAALLGYLGARSAVCRMQSMHEILRRGKKPAFKSGLIALAKGSAELYARIAGIFTLKSLYGPESHETLIALCKNPAVQEWALRALADRLPQLAGVPTEPFVQGLSSPNPRVQVQAMIGLARLHKLDTAKAIVPLTTVASDWQDAKLIIPHTAVRALITLQAYDACLTVVTPNTQPNEVDGALWALKGMHVTKVVSGLAAKLSGGGAAEFKKRIISALVRLYYDEGPWDRMAWWTTRPEHVGPYYQRVTWAGTPEVESALATAAAGSAELATFLKTELDFNHITITGLSSEVIAKKKSQEDAKLLAKALAATKKVEGKAIGNLAYDDVMAVATTAKGDPKLGEELFTRQGCVTCHTIAKDKPPKGPYLGEIAKQYSRAELVESILKPSAKIAQGFATHWLELKDGTTVVGFIITEGAETITICGGSGVVSDIKTDQIVKRGEQKGSMMPEGIVNNLSPTELASLLSYFESLVGIEK